MRVAGARVWWHIAKRWQGRSVVSFSIGITGDGRSPGSGIIGLELLIVGLAPAAHGANRTGRVFTGDRSGDWLYDTLYACGLANQPTATARDDGLRLYDTFVSAAVRCAPPKNRPTPDEMQRCRSFLVQELHSLAGLRVVVVLGQLALDGFLRAWREFGRAVPSPRPRFGHGLIYRLDNRTTLIVSYHPSQQNTFTGKLTRRMFRSVFRQAARQMRAISDE